MIEKRQSVADRADEVTADEAELAAATKARDAAEQRFNSKVAARNAALQSLQTQIMELGQTRSQIQLLRGLILSEEGAKVLAERTLNSFLASQGSGYSISTKTAFTSGLESLAHFLALKPFIEPYLEKIESRAAALVVAVKAAAKADKVNLKKFLDLLRKESEDKSNVVLLQYFAAGFFADLE
ncbi:MAG: hypothetical protein ACREFE_17705 [Limisphaerales bacterium]